MCCDAAEMADNKNQHYVPRVHFRPFTLNGEDRAINLFNLDRMRTIQNTPVKNQCSGDYFYGADKKLEAAIRSVEDPYGPIVKHLIAGGSIDASVEVVLKRFILLQHFRTDAASRKTTEMLFAMRNAPGSDLPMPPFREAVKEAVQAAMRIYAKTMRIVDDLKLVIVRNRSGIDFITSDDPAVVTNRLFLQRIPNAVYSFGAKTAGALLFLPLTPSMLAILYDCDVYSISHSQRWVTIDRAEDAAALNAHQHLHCAANIYFRMWEDSDRILTEARAINYRRPEHRHTIVHAVLDQETHWGKRYVARTITDIRDHDEVLVHVSANHPAPGAWPRFLRFRPDARAWSNNTGAGLTRRGCLDGGFVAGAGYQKVQV